MNGRCQKDALDRAEDICELCGHQYCAHCLLFPRGHRNPPTCKTCALEHSGIRGSSSRRQVISKREYKKLKKQLLAQLEDVEEKEPAIECFELNDPSKFDQSNELDRRPAVVEEEPKIDILAASDDPPAPRVAPPPPPPPAPAVPAAEPIPADHAVSGLAPVDTSVNPLALGGAPTQPAPAQLAAASDPSSSAAELLARLKADQPIQSQFNAAPVGLDTDPFASAPLNPAPTSARPKSEPWSPPPAPPRGSNLDSIGNEEASAENQAPLGVTPSETAPSLEHTPRADATDHEQPMRRKADMDDSGQWIPPSLRGMSTPDERDPLPKRRS